MVSQTTLGSSEMRDGALVSLVSWRLYGLVVLWYLNAAVPSIGTRRALSENYIGELHVSLLFSVTL